MSQYPRQKSQQGMTLVELLIALTILLIGLGAIMIMIASAMANNNGSRQDTTATMLSQLVVEQIAAVPANTNPTLNIIDCSGAVRQIATAPGGAILIAAGQPNSGDINWPAQTFAALGPQFYAMRYIACGNANRQMTYEVRWNVQVLANNTKLITVSARRRDAEQNNRRTAIGFNFPVTLRMISGL